MIINMQIKFPVQFLLNKRESISIAAFILHG